MTTDGSPLRVGKIVHVEVQAFLPPDAFAHRVDLFLAEDAAATSPDWIYVGMLRTQAAGTQLLTGELSLTSGGRKALRAHLSKAPPWDPAYRHHGWRPWTTTTAECSGRTVRLPPFPLEGRTFYLAA